MLAPMITLTLAERLMLANQYEILAKLTDDETKQTLYERNVQILRSGWARLYSEMFHSMEPEFVSEG